MEMTKMSTKILLQTTTLCISVFDTKEQYGDSSDKLENSILLMCLFGKALLMYSPLCSKQPSWYREKASMCKEKDETHSMLTNVTCIYFLLALWITRKSACLVVHRQQKLEILSTKVTELNGAVWRSALQFPD